MEPCRCFWVPVDKPLYVEYHDTEWGVLSRDGRHLFEMLCLEGAQAGLSWWTVLQKRAHYREVFHGFDPEKVARMTDAELDRLVLDRLVLDPGIIRHRGKIETFRKNARAWLTLQEREGDPVAWLWSFVGGEPKRNARKSKDELPAKTAESDALSKALKKAGFGFVGSTTLYAFMQAVGMVDDHMADCFRSGK